MSLAWEETLEEGGGQDETISLANMTWGASSAKRNDMYINMSFQGSNPNASMEDMFGGGDMSFSGANPFGIYTRAVFVILYSLVFICCVVGNILVIVVVVGHRRMRTKNNFLLANLALADLCVGFFCVLPSLGLYLSPIWMFGKVMCKLLYFMQTMSYAASITILTILSFERYFAIVHPLRCKQVMTMSLLRTVMVVAWSAAIIYSIPQLIFYSVIDLELPAATVGGNPVHLAFCIVVVWHNRQAYVTINFVLLYLVPLCLMTIMYSHISMVLWRSSKTARRMSNHIPAYKSVSSKGMCCGRYKENLRPPPSPTSHAKANSGTTTDAEQMKLPRLTTKKTTSSFSNTRSGNSSSGNLRIGGLTHTLLKKVHLKSKKPVEGSLVAQRRVISLIVCFALFVLPHHVLMMWQVWHTTHQYPVPYGQLLAAPITFLILYLNSTINPLLYSILSDNFQHSLQEMLQVRPLGTVESHSKRRRSTLIPKTNQTFV